MMDYNNSWLKWCPVAVTGVYLLRRLAIFPLFFLAREQVPPFLEWSSIICIGYGVVYLVGIMQVWCQLCITCRGFKRHSPHKDCAPQKMRPELTNQNIH